ncbi:p23 [Dregea volubilis virus 1]|nr:p23 [Dregea volubilis virus 1]
MKLYFDDDFYLEITHELESIPPTIEAHGDDPSVITTVSEVLNRNAAYIPALKSDLNDVKRSDPQGAYIVRLKLLRELEDSARVSLSAIRAHIVKLLTTTTPLDSVLLFSHYYMLIEKAADIETLLATPMKMVTSEVTKHMSDSFKVDISPTTFKCSGLLNLKISVGRVFRFYLNKDPEKIIGDTVDHYTDVIDSVVLLKDVKIKNYNEQESMGELPID